MPTQSATARLDPLNDLGDNPGDLRGFIHVPRDLPRGAPLVVVLHGCTQDAASYDRGSGWSALADEQGFALLFPEQQRGNNPSNCFNWFRPGDARRGRGEAASIRQMVAAMVDAHGIDQRRIFVTGLSAGGAMTSIMLAAYPDVFAGGAVIAGLPFAVANSVPEALTRMNSAGEIDGDALGALVADASPHDGPWPTLSVWHGTADMTVSPDNGAAVVEQWRGLHGALVATSETVDGHRRDVWRDAAGREVIERYTIGGLGHGTPLGTTGDEGNGAAGPHMIEAGINSTRRIASFWGIIGQPSVAAWGEAAIVAPAPKATPVRAEPPVFARRIHRPASHPRLAGVAETIDKALRSAGLLR
ncbi:extracellular catalytic domain type 1 short-chain-length polyhydroxyalkanoate depolymerase [Sphingomonas sp. RB1R13]|uniref:extracellular catalytic domain type 1 short-chain-length polyhydroxyalkanoate depolymerase n=1 Tax=Sphingomonas sp. RB1R13 TaxID=3096159 RepID=UPI002FC7F00D